MSEGQGYSSNNMVVETLTITGNCAAFFSVQETNVLNGHFQKGGKEAFTNCCKFCLCLYFPGRPYLSSDQYIIFIIQN